MNRGTPAKPLVAPRARARRLPNTLADQPGSVPEVRLVPIDAIDLPRRPVRRFLGDIAGLAESMQDYGLQQPISVRARGDRYLLTSGLRRLHAARTLGWTSIVVFVRTVSADEAYLHDLIENLQREDLSAEEEADALGELIRTRGWTLQQVADAVKRSVAYVSKRVRIFEDPYLRDAVASRGLAISTAEELLAASAELRPSLVERALMERWDQTRARELMHADAVSSLAIEHQLAQSQSEAALVDDVEQVLGRPGDDESVELEVSRPRGFTRAVREFHRLIATVSAEDLTAADRAALRALFRDLVMIARASTSPSPRVFPPLPQGKPSRGNESASL